MYYISGNKAAWEEAFDKRREGWGDDVPARLNTEKLPFFNQDMKNELNQIDFTNKTVAQFCCNNGRELLSLVKHGALSGVGFDIAENIIGQARDSASKAGIATATFEALNIFDMPESYYNKFDFIFFTIGAITWFEDLSALFRIVSKCLKSGGKLLINDFHPVMNMLPLPGEDGFDGSGRLAYSYFRKEPWVEDNGAGYITAEKNSNTFVSFSHTLSAIINASSVNGMKTVKLNEYDYDVGLTEAYDGKGLPLSFIFIAEKDVSI